MEPPSDTIRSERTTRGLLVCGQRSDRTALGAPVVDNCGWRGVNATGIWPDVTMRPGESETRWLFRMLLQDLQTLASDAETLLRAFPPMIPAADEVALQFDDHFGFAERFVEDGLITREMLERVRAVDRILGEMSRRHDASLWTDEALRQREEWKEVRGLAREALVAMGYGLDPPPPWERTTKVVRARTDTNRHRN